MTFRTDGGNKTLCSIVWDSHGNNAPTGAREILMRDILYVDFFPGSSFIITYGPLLHVGYHQGLDPDQWGTPVISSSSSSDTGIGEYIAWSDSLAGIVARGHLRAPGIRWWPWPFLPAWTPYDTVSKYHTSMGYGVGQYPSMPPFTHRGLAQVSAPIVWQQPGRTYIGISYARLDYVAATQTLSLAFPLLNKPNIFWITPNAARGWGTDRYVHPSIDQSQDALGRIMEGISYELRRSHEPIIGPSSYWHEVFFQQMLFDTSSGNALQMGNAISYVDTTFSGADFSYPVVSSQNQVLELSDSLEQPSFTVLFMDQQCCESIKLLEAEWRMRGGPKWRRPRLRLSKTAPDNGVRNPVTYLHSGVYPNGAASEGELEDRFASLYLQTTDSALRTSRQFYSRLRPDGYEAEGLEIGATLDTSLSLGFSARLYDVWMSDDQQSEGIKMISYAEPGNLSELLGMLRTKSFQTSDSLSLGMVVDVRLYAGDSIGSVEKSIDCIVELVDSSSGDVVWRVDSARIDMSSRIHSLQLEGSADLLLGTYYVRLRLESEEFSENFALDTNGVWSVVHMSGWIESLSGKRARRVEGVAGSGIRLSAEPNPFTGETEILFSIGRREHVSLRVYDVMGREVASLIEKELYERGRYGVEFSGVDLSPGTYIVELQTLNDRVVEKVVVKK